jgi:hypothetical protein
VKTQIPSSGFVRRLPLGLFLTGCLLTLFQMFTATAGAVGVTDIFFQLIISSLLLVVLAMPVGYQMHASGNGKGIFFAFLLWTGVALFNLTGLLTSWPVKLTIASKKQDLVQLHKELQPDEVRPLGQRYGLLKVQEARRLHNARGS